MRFSPRLAVLGIDHRHIFGMLGQMMAEGAVCKGWWTAYDTPLEAGFIKRFPDLERVQDKRRLLEDPDIDMILIAAIPCERAELAIEAMRAGKDVMVDKPGCTTLEQLPQIQACVAETGRIWSVNFSERFEVPAVTKADELVRAGAIGTVKQTLGIGPHRQNLDTRPDWFLTARNLAAFYAISALTKLTNICILPVRRMCTSAMLTPKTPPCLPIPGFRILVKLS